MGYGGFSLDRIVEYKIQEKHNLQIMHGFVGVHKKNLSNKGEPLGREHMFWFLWIEFQMENKEGIF